MRVLALCVAVGFAAQTSGALEIFAPCCEDDCPEDNDDGDCAPSCASCVVAKVFPARIAPIMSSPLVLPGAEGALALVDDPVPDGVRDAVFHPPRG